MKPSFHEVSKHYSGKPSSIQRKAKKLCTSKQSTSALAAVYLLSCLHRKESPIFEARQVLVAQKASHVTHVTHVETSQEHDMHQSARSSLDKLQPPRIF